MSELMPKIKAGNSKTTRPQRPAKKTIIQKLEKNDPLMTEFVVDTGFITHSDKVLEEMLIESCVWVDSLGGDWPYCISLLGSQGTGKTLLARAMYRYAKKHHGYFINEKLRGIKQARDIYFKPASEISTCVREGNWDQFEYLRRAWLLVIDDLGSEYDKSGFALSKMVELINSRMGKWTIITSNLELQQISQVLDPRIASRLIREGNKFVGVDTIDYALRK